MAEVTILEALERIPPAFHSLPKWFLLGGHCLSIAHWFKGKYGQRYLFNCIMGFLMAFGGGLFSALWIGVRRATAAADRPGWEGG